MRLLLLCLNLFTASHFLAQDTLRALFIGNSYMGVNNLPQMVKDLSTSLSDVLIFDSNTPGGQTFQNHAANPVNYQKMAAQPWDYIILQGQSQEPSFPFSQVNSATLPYAVQLADSAKSILARRLPAHCRLHKCCSLTCWCGLEICSRQLP